MFTVGVLLARFRLLIRTCRLAAGLVFTAVLIVVLSRVLVSAVSAVFDSPCLPLSPCLACPLSRRFACRVAANLLLAALLTLLLAVLLLLDSRPVGCLSAGAVLVAVRLAARPDRLCRLAVLLFARACCRLLRVALRDAVGRRLLAGSGETMRSCFRSDAAEFGFGVRLSFAATQYCTTSPAFNSCALGVN